MEYPHTFFNDFNISAFNSVYLFILLVVTHVPLGTKGVNQAFDVPLFTELITLPSTYLKVVCCKEFSNLSQEILLFTRSL